MRGALGHAVFFIGLATGAVILGAFWLAYARAVVAVGEGESVLLLGDKGLIATVERPGWHWVPRRVFERTTLRRVSRRHDPMRVVGTVVKLDGTLQVFQVWLDFRVARPAQTLTASALDVELQRAVVEAAREALGVAELAGRFADLRFINHELRSLLALRCARFGVEVASVIVTLTAAYQPTVSTVPHKPRRVRAAGAARQRPS